MGEAIPRQHPAVVLRSHFNQLRALLAVALIAVAGLTVAVVILANDSDQVSSTSAAKPIESIRYGDFNPATGRPESAGSIRSDRASAGTSSAREQDLRHLRAGGVARQPNVAPDTRYDGGPEEGTADVTPAQPKVTQQQVFPGLANQADQAQSPAYSSKSATKDYGLNGATGDFSTEPEPQTGSRSDGEPDQGTR
jgi:hypothetical protein